MKYLPTALLLLLHLVCAAPIYAQVSEQQILLSGDYLFGQAYGETRQEAVNNARVALIEKLVVTVTNEAELNVRDDAEAFESEFVSRTQTLSRMQLRGLDVRAEERRDGSWEALAYISNEDYRRSMDTARQSLVRLLQSAEMARENGQPGDALRDYTSLLMQRPFYPLPLYADEVLETAPGRDIAEFAARQLERQLGTVEMELRELQSYSDPVELVLELQLRYPGGQPVQNVEIGFDLSGYGFIPVTDGYVQLSLDVLPERLLASYPLRLRPVYESADESEAALAASALPSVSRRLEIDFSPHVRLDFSATPVGTGGYQFQPLIENLAVKQVAWNFGGGLSSSRLNPRQAFTPAQMREPRRITLTLNGRQELSVEKELRPDGSLHPVESYNESRPAAQEPDTQATRRTSADASEIPVAAYPVPAAHESVVNALVRSQNWEQTQRILARARQENRRIRFGSREAIGASNTLQSYVIILNPDSRAVEAVLTPERGGMRQNLRNSENITNLRDDFAGRAPVWVLLP